MATRALLVTGETYLDRQHWPPLQFPAADNDQFGQLLLTFGVVNAGGLLRQRNATRAAIMDGLAWLARDAQAGDLLVFHFSGHGTSGTRDEVDGTRDEDELLLCPIDYDLARPETGVSDDDVASVLRAVPRGTRIEIVLDCCDVGIVDWDHMFEQSLLDAYRRGIHCAVWFAAGYGKDARDGFFTKRFCDQVVASGNGLTRKALLESLRGLARSEGAVQQRPELVTKPFRKLHYGLPFMPP